jgi:hypothetical protein
MAIARESIRAEWNVSDVLARQPQLLQLLIDLIDLSRARAA